MNIDVPSLKILLKLLEKPDYKAPVGQVKPNDKTKISEQTRLCRQLKEQKYIDYSEETTKIKLTSTGKEVLKLELKNTPLSETELKILQGCIKGAIAPSQTKITPAAKRDEAIEKAMQRGFLEVAETKIKEVWLTDEGKEFLAREYVPSGGGNISLSKGMIGDYLRFLRKYLGGSTAPSFNNDKVQKWGDDEILQLIKDLDRELGTENYLPIFYLREKLQPPMSRDEVDQALYRLQRQDKLEMSCLVESVRYTNEQIQSGIPQDIGGSLFFLITN
ncbi:conserved hypothetical protein [Gloeothece citriformis PCC 7424]|uniref:Uncharacterized protein n=1 Tax=Gloeothece citriformis (strain PCC 7424) TaxID=65393 RepID=B7KH05_GLOC7|nr:hypothetical protein [Gloeothece citriformis]ACK73492.1 conserved hypothetical protein [Gloeothece citriformis PCC 7424]